MMGVIYMKLNQIEIQYDTYYDKWLQCIQQGLNEHDIIYQPELPTVICQSVKVNVDKYLKNNGYRPKKYFYYRKDLASRLRKYGLKLQIKSNNVLWKYLEYFTDIEDYSLCFDIGIVVYDVQKAMKDCIFVLVDNNIVGIPKQPINTDKHINMVEQINFLRQYNKQYNVDNEFNNKLLDLLEDIVKEFD